MVPAAPIDLIYAGDLGKGTEINTEISAFINNRFHSHPQRG
jgi:hypothetical protein